MPGFLDPLSSRVDFLSLNNNLTEALLEADNQNESNTSMCLDIMHDNGMLTFANLYQRSCDDIPINYEILWRLCQWDDQTERTHHVDWSNNLELEYNKHHYLALMSINKREQENTLSAINNAYQCVQRILQDISIECLQSVYKYMTWLCTLQQTEDFYQVCVFVCVPEGEYSTKLTSHLQIQFSQQLAPSQVDEIFNKWQTELNLTYGSFSCKEQILAHQITLFKQSGTRADRRIKQYYDQSPVDSYMLKCIQECQSAGKLNLATKYISTLRTTPEIKSATQVSVHWAHSVPYQLTLTPLTDLRAAGGCPSEY